MFGWWPPARWRNAFAAPSELAVLKTSVSGSAILMLSSPQSLSSRSLAEVSPAVAWLIVQQGDPTNGMLHLVLPAPTWY